MSQVVTKGVFLLKVHPPIFMAQYMLLCQARNSEEAALHVQEELRTNLKMKADTILHKQVHEHCRITACVHINRASLLPLNYEYSFK